MSTHNTNPGNFANRDPEEVKAIASMGGKASHGGHHQTEETERNDSADLTGRNPDGTFTKGSEVAKAAGHKGGQHSHDHDGEKGGEQEAEEIDTGRNPDGTFKKGSEAAKEAGHKSHGGH